MKDQSVIQSAGASGVSSLGAIKNRDYPNPGRRLRRHPSCNIESLCDNLRTNGADIDRHSLIMVFVAACIVYQIKVIFFKTKSPSYEDFSYAMVHDMKTPLSSIQLGLRLLYSNKQTGEKREKKFSDCGG